MEYLLDVTYGSATAVSFEVNGLEGTSDTGARNFGDDNIVLWTAPESATYYVKVAASAKALEPTGTYTLKITPDVSLRDRHSDIAANATLIGFGHAIAGAVSPASDYDYFRISAERGIAYTVNVNPGTTDGVRFLLRTNQPDSQRPILVWKRSWSGLLRKQDPTYWPSRHPDRWEIL